MTQLRTLVREPQAGGRAASVTTTRQGAGGTTPASRARPELDYELRHWLRQAVSDRRLARARQLLADEPRATDDCERCGEPFAPTQGQGGPPQRFCSARCRKRQGDITYYRRKHKEAS